MFPQISQCCRPRQSTLRFVFDQPQFIAMAQARGVAENKPTFLKLLDKVLNDRLQLLAAHGELILEVLDLLQKILWHVMHGAYPTARISMTQQLEEQQSLPLREGGCLGPIPTILNSWGECANA